MIRQHLATVAALVGLLLTGNSVGRAQTPPPGQSQPGMATPSAATPAPTAERDPRLVTPASPAGQQVQPGGQAAPHSAAVQMAVGRRVWPQGAGTGSLVVEKHTPPEVRPGQAFSYRLVVINPTGEAMRNVVLTETNPEVLRIVSTNPEGRAVGKGATQWNLGEIAASSSREVIVNGTVTQRVEQVVSCVTVTHDVVACWAIKVTEPKLQLAQTMPAAALMCDEIPVQITVQNVGTGVARGVRAVTQLPSGLTTLDNQSVVNFDLGDLPSGQARQFAIKTKAVQPGDYTINTSLVTETGPAAEKATNRLRVDQPVLAITKEAPKLRLIGRSVNYQIIVTNKGTVDARDVVVKDQVPAGVRILGASDEGKFNQGTNEVLWNLGVLAAKQSRELALVLAADQPGELNNTAVASAYCAQPVSATSYTKITGIPAILLEVIDVEDPVEVGADTTYVITVTNQGSATGTNIKIECTLENTMQYVASDGATPATFLERKVVFDPLPALKPKAKASWRVVVKALTPGDVRFMVKMDSDQIQRSVAETEATNFYQ